MLPSTKSIHFTVVGDNRTVEATACDLTWALSKERFHEARRVAVAFCAVT
jgi:hypothetical protein